MWVFFFIFSSLKLKTLLSFFDHLSSGVCLSVCPFINITFSTSFAEPLGLFQPNIYLGERNPFFSNHDPRPFPSEDTY